MASWSYDQGERHCQKGAAPAGNLASSGDRGPSRDAEPQLQQNTGRICSAGHFYSCLARTLLLPAQAQLFITAVLVGI